MFRTSISTCCVLLSFLGVGTQAKRDVVLGKYVSHMHPGTDILVRQSFLLQGQPDSVIGVQFGYDSAVQQDFEDFLFTELNSPPTKAINPLKNTLWFLSGNLYRDHKHVMLVITADNRKVMIPALQRQLNTQKLRPRDEVIVRAELFYLSWKPTSNTNEQLIREVASVKSSVAPIVARNLREVSRQLTIHSSVGKGWERVGIYR